MRKDTSQKNATFKLEITILVNRHINKFILIRISGTYLSKNLQTFFNLFLALQIFFGCNLDVDFSGQDLARAPQLEKKNYKRSSVQPERLASLENHLCPIWNILTEYLLTEYPSSNITTLWYRGIWGGFSIEKNWKSTWNFLAAWPYTFILDGPSEVINLLDD